LKFVFTTFNIQYDAISIRTKWRCVYIRDETRSEKSRYRSSRINTTNVKQNTIPILMHQMRISTTESLQWSLSRKSWKSEKKNCEKCIRAEKNQILCHEIEPNPLKDRAMHERDNPSF
jgi:hypothetical protein